MPDHNLTAGAKPPREGEAMMAQAARPSRWRRWALLAAAFAVLGAAVMFRDRIAALMPKPPAAATAPAGAPPPALTVATAAVALQSLARSIVGDGSVVAWQELVVGVEAGGLRVAELLVEDGDRVAKGDLLVRLDDSVLAAQRDQSAAAVEEAEAALRIARQDLARSTELSRSQNVARQTLEQRDALARQAEARLDAARARLAEVTARVAQTRILAPEAGLVLRRPAMLGAVTAVGQEMVRLARDGRLELDARVPELELSLVHPGQPVRVTHGGRVLEARVRAVAPTVAPETRLGIVHVALPEGSGLRPGMFARAEIMADTVPVLTVPQEAVVFRDGRPAVFVVPAGGDAVALRPLATGRRAEGMVEVTEGLSVGERVVVAGAGFLSDGDHVQVADQPPSPRTAAR